MTELSEYFGGTVRNGWSGKSLLQAESASELYEILLGG
jgi:hypothetical protein